MKNSGEIRASNEEARRKLIYGLIVGIALGVLFWSALDGLLPFPLDLVVGMITGLLVGYAISKRPQMTMRYSPIVIRRLLLTGSATMLGVFAYRYLLTLKMGDVGLLLSSLVAIVPAMAFIWAIGSAISNLDELQRRIQTEAIAIAFAGTAAVVIVFFFLGFVGVPAPNWGWPILVMAFTWLLGKLWTMWRCR